MVEQRTSGRFGGEDDGRDEVARFVDGHGYESTVVAQVVAGDGRFDLLVADRKRDQRERDHGESGVAVLAVPGTDLGLVETELVLGDLEGLLDDPTASGYCDQVGEPGGLGVPGQV